MALSIVSWLGLVIMLLGLGLRVWSMRVLGAYYSRTLRVTDTQVIVTQGPYRIVRHPGYLGTILLWVGSGRARQLDRHGSGDLTHARRIQLSHSFGRGYAHHVW